MDTDCQRQNCTPETLVFSDISLVQIFAVFVVQTAIEVAYYAHIVAILLTKQGKELRCVTCVRISIYRLRACALSYIFYCFLGYHWACARSITSQSRETFYL